MEANYFPAHQWLASAYIQKSMPEEAIQHARKAADLSNESTVAMTGLALSYSASGNTKEARRILQRLQAASKSRYISSYEISAIFASLNEPDHAFESLQKAYDNRDYELYRLKREPRFDNIRSDPRFADLLRRVGIPP